MNKTEKQSKQSGLVVERWSGQSGQVEQTLSLANAIGRCAVGGDMIGLIGELGAGKTQFVRGLAAGLGVDEQVVSSPTFVFVQEYRGAEGAEGSGGRRRLVHIDAYRVTGLADLESIGFESYCGFGGDHSTDEADEGEQPVVAVEWADRIEEELGDDRLMVALYHEGLVERGVSIVGHGSWAARIKALRGELDRVCRAAIAGQPKTGAKPEGTGGVGGCACPICQKVVVGDSPWLPFCSRQCKTIDLGQWASEAYRISRPIEQSDLDEQ